jgi:hypothetical protein
MYFWYNPQTHACELVTTSSGNDTPNSFATLDECMRLCGGPADGGIPGDGGRLDAAP